MNKIFRVFYLSALLGGICLTSCAGAAKGDGISNTPNVKMDTTFYNPLDLTKGLGDPWL